LCSLSQRPADPASGQAHEPERVVRARLTRILRELSQMWTRLTGQPEEELLVSLWENPAENAMEGGSIFPDIGQE
jgi:hypothetical protein